MNSIDFLGTLAGTLTTIAFVPQVVKTWRSDSADDISLGMFVLFTIGVLCWLVYGVALTAWPIIVANSITLVLAATILGLKVKDIYRNRQRRREADQRSL